MVAMPFSFRLLCVVEDASLRKLDAAEGDWLGNRTDAEPVRLDWLLAMLPTDVDLLLAHPVLSDLRVSKLIGATTMI